MPEDAFEHHCEVCGTVAMLTPEEAFTAGWDYPPRMGRWGVISPRTCPSCPMTSTLWWAVTYGGLQTDDPMGWPEDRRRTLVRIWSEQDDHPEEA
jgi:hypothetical protein